MADEAKKRSRGSKKGSMKGSKKGSKKKVVSNKGGKPTRTPIIPTSKREKVNDVDMDRQAHDDDEEEEEEEQQHEEEEARVWRPGVDPLEEGEELDYDSSAYLAFHRMTVDWPCLSFDIIKDSLGQFRKNFPMQMYMVSGTQADQASKNKVMMLKISNIRKTKNDEAAEDDVVHSSDDDDDDDEVAGQPVLQERWWKHAGGVNRLRCMPQSPGFVATWADTGRVHIWDASHLLHSLDKPTSSSASSSAALANQNAAGFDLKPVYTFGGHTTEGFALDWSRCTPGRLATGDCDKFIYIWNSRTEGGTWDVNKVPYVSHTASVEDIQWSPNEAAVFASCSVDKTIRVWDVRQHDKSMLFVAAHKSDVNVISWNSKVSHLLLSGADDGGVKVWDLRKFRSDSPAAHFKWHSKAITSVEWHPTDESIMAVSSADNTVSVWDMAIEDDSEVTQEGAKLESHVPAQLLFVHQGQQDPKEVHWHPNIPGLLVSTAADGYNIFKPANLEPDEDEEEEDEGDDDVDV